MYKFYFFTIVKRGEEMTSSEMTTAETQSGGEEPTVVKLKEFADNYFATNKYEYKFGDNRMNDNRGKPCTEFYIHNPKMEDCGNYYLLSDFTVSHDRILPSYHYMFYVDKEVNNVKIKMNKNNASKACYNYQLTGSNDVIDTFKISSELKYYNGYPYYPVISFNLLSGPNGCTSQRYTLSYLKKLVNEEKWFHELSRFYYLVDSKLIMDRIEKLRDIADPSRVQRRIKELIRKDEERRRRDEEIRRLNEEFRRKKEEEEERKRQEKERKRQEKERRQQAEEEETIWMLLQIEEERRRQAEEYRRRREEERRRREEEQRRRREEEQRRRREEERRRQAEEIILAKVKIHDEVEKEDVTNINALYKDIKDGKIMNMTNSMKKILLSYIANVSENVQFQLQDEIKEIYKELNNINDDLQLYIHNI